MFRRIQATLRTGCVFLAIGLAACSNQAPAIDDKFWQLNLVYDQDTGLAREELSVFAITRDDDGSDDIEFIYILNDKAELFWRLAATTWQEIEVQGNTWRGSASLRMSDNRDFPRGDYRLQVIDKSGSRSETEVFLTSPTGKKNTQFPEASLFKRSLRVSGHAAGYFLWFYNGEDELISFYQGAANPLNLNQIDLPPAAFSETTRGTSTSETEATNTPDQETEALSESDYGYYFYVGIFDEYLGIGLLNGPYQLN